MKLTASVSFYPFMGGDTKATVPDPGVGYFLFGHESGHSIARPIALRATGSHPSGRSSEKVPAARATSREKVKLKNPQIFQFYKI